MKRWPRSRIRSMPAFARPTTCAFDAFACNRYAECHLAADLGRGVIEVPVIGFCQHRALSRLKAKAMR
jgi:hypothetical protein